MTTHTKITNRYVLAFDKENEMNNYKRVNSSPKRVPCKKEREPG